MLSLEELFCSVDDSARFLNPCGKNNSLAMDTNTANEMPWLKPIAGFGAKEGVQGNLPPTHFRSESIHHVQSLGQLRA